MKIAIPTTQPNLVDSHFGHCEFYTIFTIGDDKKILNSELLPSPTGCGCKSNIASTLREMGVTVLLAGNMGNGAVNVITGQGIRVIRGCEGKVDSVVNDYLSGKISDSGLTCAHHHDDHVCNH
jgi:predicted Fe-Mo cluster-binding NifX family protein